MRPYRRPYREALILNRRAKNQDPKPRAGGRRTVHPQDDLTPTALETPRQEETIAVCPCHDKTSNLSAVPESCQTCISETHVSLAASSWLSHRHHWKSLGDCGVCSPGSHHHKLSVFVPAHRHRKTQYLPSMMQCISALQTSFRWSP